MDKYEFNVKIEKLKRLAEEKDYAAAQKIVDSIDWTRVRNTGLLTLAASVDEANGRLDDAKDKLVIALERAPVGKRILYKLTELAVRSGNVEEAEDYYEEYHNLAPDDPGCLLLQYMIMKVKHTPYPQLIECLELYNRYETDEKWMYELATTYESAGRIQDMVAVCDRIALMFGNSAYAVKALKLKGKYVKLTDEQRALLHPSSIAGTGVHYVKDDPEYQQRHQTEEEQAQASEGDLLAADRLENEDDLFRIYAMKHDPLRRAPVPAFETGAPEVTAPAEEPSAEEAEVQPEAVVYTAARQSIPTEMPYETESYEAEPYEEAEAVPAAETEVEETGEAVQQPVSAAACEAAAAEAEPAPIPAKVPEREVIREAAEDVVHTALTVEEAEKAAGICAEPYPAPAAYVAPAASAVPVTPAAPAAPDVSIPAPAPVPAPERPKKPAPAPVPVMPRRPAPPVKPATPLVNAPAERRNMIVEADDDQVGLNIAVGELRRFHAEFGASGGAVKIAAEKLNECGISGSVKAKLRGKDFVVEHAGELDPEVADQLYELMLDDTDGTTVVLIDNPSGLDKLEEMKPEMFELSDYISDEDAADEAVMPAEEPAPAKKQEMRQPEPEDEEDEYGEEDEEAEEPAPDRRPVKAVTAADGEDLSVDDFVAYCDQYAADIDCVIDTTSHLALYERAELMEEEGIPLNKNTAAELIEETADKAENPRSLARRFKKYDKNGCLILKEEDFLPGDRK